MTLPRPKTVTSRSSESDMADAALFDVTAGQILRPFMADPEAVGWRAGKYTNWAYVGPLFELHKRCEDEASFLARALSVANHMYNYI